MEFSFNLYNSLAPTGILMALNRLLGAEKEPPVVLCVGSDLVVGDALGPVTGTLVCGRTAGLPCYIYGDLSAPVTAKEVKYVNEFLRRTHPNRKIVVVDAAVGEEGDVGLIRVTDGGLRPGSGAKKRLPKVGDVSIMGIVAERSLFNYTVLNSIRLNVVYKMSEVIAEALSSLLWNAYKAPMPEEKEEARP